MIQKIRRMRIALNPEEIGLRAGFDQIYISRVERGQFNITVLTFMQLAAALDPPPSQLLRLGEKGGAEERSSELEVLHLNRHLEFGSMKRNHQLRLSKVIRSPEATTH